MPDPVTAAGVYWEILRWVVAGSAILILASSLDDLLIDLAYWWSRIVGFCSFWVRPPAQYRLDTAREKPIAILVPAWQESSVIASMITNTINTFDYDRYHIFVGVYENDPDTAREVDRVRERFANIHRARVPHDGPTSKADCLNWIVQNIRLFEQQRGETFDIFVLHDAEDVVHPYGLKTVNWFIEEAAMIQMPVLSMDRRWNQIVACHYMDEFAEFHGKDLPVRSAIAGMTPSAGVATAFHRLALEALMREGDGQAFNADSLTEDYDVAHRLTALGYPSRFVRYHARVPRTRRAWLRPGTVAIRRRELVATREFFPDEYTRSLRQKARWMLGISLMGWRQLGWFGSLANRYFLFRDRKSLITAPTGALAYVLVLHFILAGGVEWIWPDALDLPSIFLRPWVETVVGINLIFLLNRLAHRAWFTGTTHGLRHVPLSPLRIVVSNFIAFSAFWRACRQFLVHLSTGAPIAWDKTRHAYPSIAELQQGGGRLGETLRFWNHLGEADLVAALAAQKDNYRPLGLLLLDRGAIDDEVLAEAFASRHDSFATSVDPAQIAPSVLRLLTADEAARYSVVPLRRSGTTLELAAAEPVSAADRTRLQRRLARTGVRKVRILFAPLSDVAFAIRFAWSGEPFQAIRDRIASDRAAGVMDAAGEFDLWKALRRRYLRLGDLLVRGGRITHADLEAALIDARARGLRLGETLVEQGAISATDLDAALAAQSRLSAADARVSSLLHP